MTEPSPPRVWSEEMIRVGINTSKTLAEKRAVVLRAYDETEAALRERVQAVQEAQREFDHSETTLAGKKNAEANARVLLQHAKQQMVALMHKDA